jgi:2-methylisocitrate lyase-like PEP mutase family enzyme
MNTFKFDFKLTRQCENFLRGNPGLDDTIRRLQAHEALGMKVLMARGLPNLAAVWAVCDAASKPFNFKADIAEKSFTFIGLEEVGVHRVSLATSL